MALRARVQGVWRLTVGDAGDFQVAGGGSAIITTTHGWERKKGKEEKEEKKTEEDRGRERRKNRWRGGRERMGLWDWAGQRT